MYWKQFLIQKPPKPSEAWSGVRSAKDDAGVCVQRNIFIHQEDVVGIEDCLYLNVYTASIPDPNKHEQQESYPVMIWIHGGGFVTGAGDSKSYGPKFLLDKDVVLVTINYR